MKPTVKSNYIKNKNQFIVDEDREGVHALQLTTILTIRIRYEQKTVESSNISGRISRRTQRKRA